MLDAHGEVVARLRAAHVLDDGDEVAGADVAAAQAGRAAEEPRHAGDCAGIPVCSAMASANAALISHSCGFDCIIGMSSRSITEMALHVPQRPHNIHRRERPEAGDVQQARP